MSKAAASGSPPASDADTIRKLNQIINLIDCPKDLNDSGNDVWGDAKSRGTIENNLAIMIAQLFVDPTVATPANAIKSINEVFGENNQYKVIGDDKPKMSRIISEDPTIRPYLEDKNNIVEIVRLKHSTGAGGGLSGFFVCQDNGPSDVIVNPIYLITGGSLLDPASRTTSGENVRYLFPGWNGITPARRTKLAKASELPGRYIKMLNMEGCIQTSSDGQKEDKFASITITESAAASAAGGAPTGWTATIKLLNKTQLEGKFNNKMQATSPEFAGNDTKNRFLASNTDIDRGKKFLLAKELGDTLQVLWLKYICDLEGIPPPSSSVAQGSATAATVTGGQSGGAVREEKYDYANTCVITTDIPLKWRAIVNGVGVVHTGKDGTFYYKPRGKLTDAQQGYVNTVLKTKLMEELLNHNESIMNAIQDVIISKFEGSQWIGEVSWNLKQVLLARNYLTYILNSLRLENNKFADKLKADAANTAVTVQKVKDYTSTRYFVSPFVMKKNRYHPLRCVQPIYSKSDAEDNSNTIIIGPILPSTNYKRLSDDLIAAAPMVGGANNIFDNFIIECWKYAKNQGSIEKLKNVYRAYHTLGMVSDFNFNSIQREANEAALPANAAALPAAANAPANVAALPANEVGDEKEEELDDRKISVSRAVANAADVAAARAAAEAAAAAISNSANAAISSAASSSDDANTVQEAARLAAAAADGVPEGTLGEINRTFERSIAEINGHVNELYGIFNKDKVPQPRDQTRIPWAILGKDETDPLYTRQLNQYLRKTMISNTTDTFSPNEQSAIDDNDSCYRVLIRNIVGKHTSQNLGIIKQDRSNLHRKGKATTAAVAAVSAEPKIDIDYLQLQLVSQMKDNQPNTSLFMNSLYPDQLSNKISEEMIKAPFNEIFVFYYVYTYYPDFFTFGTMMSIGLLEFKNFESEAKLYYSMMGDIAHFDDNGLFHYDKTEMITRFRNNERAYEQFEKDCIRITKTCIKYTRYFIEKYPQVATQSLKLFINLFTHKPLSDLLTNLFESSQVRLRALNLPPMSGGGNEIDLLPMATDIAMNMYELHYSLRINAAYSDRKMEDLYMERGRQIFWYEKAIQEMNAENASDPYRLALLEYERHILCKQFIELPVVKAEFLKIQQKLSRSTSSRSTRYNTMTKALPSGITAGGSRFKKTRKNRKLKKLKQSYKKTRNALRKSRKH